MIRPSLVLVLLLAPLAARCADAQAPATPATESCISRLRDITHNSNVSRNDDREFDWRASGCQVRIRFSGDLRFSEDFRTIAGVPRGTSFRVVESGPVDRKLDIREGDGGALRYTYEVDGQERPWNAEGQAYLESVLLQLFRRAGYAAKERSQWILRTAGPDGVFAEMERMIGDYPRHMYSVALLQHTGTDAAMQARVLETAATWSSDYYKSELLDALTKSSADSRVVRAGWKVARSLESDYYATKGIQRLLGLGQPSASEAEIALAALEGIDSDYYRAELLKSISRQVPLEGRVVPLYLNAAERSESDYYRAEMLAALVDRGPLSREHLLAAIRASTSLKSEYYRTQALTRIARKHELKGEALDAYNAAVDGIRSSHYRGEAARAVRGVARQEGVVSQ